MTPVETGPILFERAAIIGFGNLGSSVARALRKAAAVREITACDADGDVTAKARELDLADDYETDAARAVRDADLVILAAPISAYAPILKKIKTKMMPGAILTDVGSVKAAVVELAEGKIPDGVSFVAGHPIAGSEKSGPEHGHPDLFDGRYWILTPTEETDPVAITRLTVLWERCGAIVEQMDAAYHDRVLAMTSHLPHLIAYSIVGTAFDLESSEQKDVIRFSAGGFRDFTRLAGSDPIMWRDVFLNNREAILEILQRFGEDLSYLQRAIRWGEGDKLEALFSQTREVRSEVIDAKQEKPYPEGDAD
jgi:cyclohexadieny/prephenate dehydrogenase